MAIETMGAGVMQSSPHRSGVRNVFEKAAILTVFGAALYGYDHYAGEHYAKTHNQPAIKTAPAVTHKL